VVCCVGVRVGLVIGVCVVSWGVSRWGGISVVVWSWWWVWWEVVGGGGCVGCGGVLVWEGVGLGFGGGWGGGGGGGCLIRFTGISKLNQDSGCMSWLTVRTKNAVTQF